MRRYFIQQAVLNIGLSGRLLASAVLLVSLTACATVTERSPAASTPGEGARPLSAQAREPRYVLAVDLAQQDTLRSIEAEYGGDVLVWEPDRFAIVGLQAPPEEGKAGFGLPGDANEKLFVPGGERAFEVEGTSTMWAGGVSTLWAGGTSTMWAGGVSTLWAGGVSTLWAGGGRFEWMPQNSELWRQVGLEEAHGRAPELGRSVKVAVIDTGVDLRHPALTEALAPESQWWDFVDNDRVPQEEAGGARESVYGHGTNVAGIIRQVAPGATILPIRVLDSDGRGDVADLAAAIHWAVEMKADVINLSLGADKHVNTVDRALRRAAEEGVFVITSAGNDQSRKVSYPASSTSSGPGNLRLLSVTSVDDSDRKSWFANYSVKVELAAPGEGVYGPAPENKMAAWSGTSMAAPMAAGAVALALAQEPDLSGSNLLENLKRHSFDLYQASSEYRNELGEGRLDIVEFLAHVLPEGG